MYRGQYQDSTHACGQTHHKSPTSPKLTNKPKPSAFIEKGGFRTAGSEMARGAGFEPAKN